MRIQSAHLSQFKRFQNLTIVDLPSSARLVLVAGANGFGKSSLFDAFNLWSGRYGGRGLNEDGTYYDRRDPPDNLPGPNRVLQPDLPSPNDAPQRRVVVGIKFHGVPPENNVDMIVAKKAFYIRSAYRNDPEVAIGGLTKLGSVLDEERVRRLIDTDATVGRNYLRLVSNAFESAFESKNAGTTLGSWCDNITGNIRDAMQRLFPHLVLDSLGSPLQDPTFRFTKGEQHGFLYKNLSGGEKAAFDLLLDLVVKGHEYDDTIFCIDEPEAHLNPRVYRPLLGEIIKLIPPKGQLWVATHAIGMMRAAQDLECREPGSVAFLDFDGYDFDRPVILRPVRPTRTFWANALRVALDDMANLVAPRELVVCEGRPGTSVPGKNADHDARCYRAIFGDQMPEVDFVSGGGSSEVASDHWGIAGAFTAVIKGTMVRRLIDRDDHTPEAVEESGESVLQS